MIIRYVIRYNDKTYIRLLNGTYVCLGPCKISFFFLPLRLGLANLLTRPRSAPAAAVSPAAAESTRGHRDAATAGAARSAGAGGRATHGTQGAHCAMAPRARGCGGLRRPQGIGRWSPPHWASWSQSFRAAASGMTLGRRLEASHCKFIFNS